MFSISMIGEIRKRLAEIGEIWKGIWHRTDDHSPY